MCYITNMKASLKDFVQTGAFGFIELGMSRTTVQQHLGSPDDWIASAPNFQTSTSWWYGDIEFLFRNDELYRILMDDFSVLNVSGGSKVELDAWFINGSLTCANAEHLLSENGITYRKQDFPYNDNGVHLVTSAGTVLAFCGEDASHITLHACSREIKAKA